MGISKEEQEVHLTYDPITDRWSCYTSYKPGRTRFVNAGWTIIHEDEYATTLQAPTKGFGLISPRTGKARKPLTEEQLEARREHGRKLGEARKKAAAGE